MALSEMQAMMLAHWKEASMNEEYERLNWVGAVYSGSNSFMSEHRSAQVPLWWTEAVSTNDT